MQSLPYVERISKAKDYFELEFGWWIAKCSSSAKAKRAHDPAFAPQRAAREARLLRGQSAYDRPVEQLAALAEEHGSGVYKTILAEELELLVKLASQTLDRLRKTG